MFAGAVIVVAAASCVFSGVRGATQPPPQYYQQYLQQVQNQPQYISVPPIPQGPTPLYEGPPHHQLSQQQYIPAPPTQRVSQLLLPSAADRQVQKAAEQIAGPQYAQQVQIAQQQGLANEVIANSQRRAQWQLMRAQNVARQQIARQNIGAVQQQYLADNNEPIQQQQQQYASVQSVQPQQYQLQYEQAYQQPTSKPLRAIPNRASKPNQQREQEEDEHDNDSSYQFGFDVKDDLYTNYQNRKEQREGGKISGSYSVVDSDGYIRTVTYTADPKDGFKAEVVRQPTDIVVKVPKPRGQEAQQPQQHYIQDVPVQRYQPQQQQQQPILQQQQHILQQQQHLQHQPQQLQQQQPKIVYQYQ